MKMVYPLLLFHAVASRVIGLRLQVSMDHFADVPVLKLNLVTESHRFIDGGLLIGVENTIRRWQRKFRVRWVGRY